MLENGAILPYLEMLLPPLASSQALAHKTYYPIPFLVSAPSFFSIDDRDQGLLSAYSLTPTYSFSKLGLYHILLLDN